MITDLPSFFRDVWNKSWGDIQNGPSIFVVPLVRKGEKMNRMLHAKALSLSDGAHELLLCGSSNFTPHGMGITVANVEANLCHRDVVRAGGGLDARLPVRWNDENDNDLCYEITWSAKVEPPEDESPNQSPIPRIFRAVTFNERAAKLTIFFETTQTLPAVWSVVRPSAKAIDAATVLLDSQQMKTVPPDGQFIVEMPVSLRGVMLTCVRIVWIDHDGQSRSGWLPVQTESLNDLLPPEQFRGFTSENIMNCLISGRDPSELVNDDQDSSVQLTHGDDTIPDYDPLREIDTTGYTLYQVRKLGQSLAAMAERLLRTAHSNEAVTYRLCRDPLGPVSLADALAKDLTGDGQISDTTQMRAAQLTFSFVEIALTLAHTCRRVHANRHPGDHDVRPAYREVINDLLEKARNRSGKPGAFVSLNSYMRAVSSECNELVGDVNQP